MKKSYSTHAKLHIYFFKGTLEIACESVRELIHKASQSKGIIMTDHNFREVHKIANRILLLDQGALKEIKEKSELISYGYYNVSVKPD